MDPVGGGIFAGVTGKDWLMAGSSVLSAALSPAPAAPSTATQMLDQKWDFGNWTVATGGGDAKGGTSGVALSPWLVFGVVVVVALAWKNKKS